jgi:DnaJ-class molecular chaperone
MPSCKTCSGKGSVKCPKCKGSGRTEGGLLSSPRRCDNCHGSGVVKCGVCHGKGYV